MRMGQPTPGDGYLTVARDLIQAVEALSTLSKIPPRGCALIAAQALECALKAFLWYKGKKKEIRARKIQHKIVKLWNMAFKEQGLNIPKIPPDWVTTLSSGHEPFYFRYQEGKGGTIFHGGVTPALIPMAAELKNFIEIVQLTIKNKR